MTGRFEITLQKFAATVAANDGAALAALFLPDGVYEDGFFGAHRGRDAIIRMLQRFHDTGRDYRWDFSDPVCDATLGYARFCFSYRSRLPESDGMPVVFDGISQFRFAGELIAHYRESFDRGVALAQLGFAPERIRRIVEKAAAALAETPEGREHLARFGR